MLKHTILTILGVVLAAPEAERVTSMPNMPAFDWGVYSGYIPIANTTKNLHYLLVES